MRISKYETVLAVFIVTTLISLACYGQSVENRATTGTRNDAGLNWVQPNGTYAARPGSPLAGQVYIVTDTLCDGTGSPTTPTPCRWSGSVWQSIGGSISQVNSLRLGGGTPFQRVTDCTTFTVALAGGTWTYPGGTVLNSTLTNPSAEFTVITGLTGLQRYNHVVIGESVLFASASVTATRVSMGRPGNSTDDELIPQTLFMQSGGNAWFAFDRPQPPAITAGGYTIVVAIRTTGDNVSALTAGTVYGEVCGYAVQ